MIELVLALAFLFLTHYGISSTRLRDLLVARLGETPYRAVYGLIALGALIWLSSAYHGADYLPLWPPLPALAIVTHLCMLLACVLLVGGLSTANPTAMEQSAALERADVVRGVLRITRHPVMWAIALWGIGHLVARGDLAALLLFGGLAAFAISGTVVLDRKFERRAGEPYRRFAAATSAVPFVAILSGRQRLALREIGLRRFGGALLLFALLLAVHPLLFGAQPQPDWLRTSAL